MFKKYISILIVVFLTIHLLSGCASVRVTKYYPDGSKNQYEYTRLFNQSIEGLTIETPDGYKITLQGQKSDTQILFELAGSKFGAGGTK